MRHANQHTGDIACHLHARGTIAVYGFFDVQDDTRLRSAAEQMLRPLKHEGPSQMRYTKNIHLHRRPDLSKFRAAAVSGNENDRRERNPPLVLSCDERCGRVSHHSLRERNDRTTKSAPREPRTEDASLLTCKPDEQIDLGRGDLEIR